MRANSAAKELGFSDVDTLERARQFAALPLVEQNRVLAEYSAQQKADLPHHEPGNPERRAERVAQQAADAPERRTEYRTRSVQLEVEAVKQEAESYLRQQYTNADDEMICQVCHAALPFKLDDGRYYVEKVEFIRELTKRHRENYLALCPNHSAMFQHVNASKDSLKKRFLEMKGNELDVVLAHTDHAIFFTKTHIADLKTIIEVDEMAQ